MADEKRDPRLNDPGEQGMPGSFDDAAHNLPGDQSPPSGDAVPDDLDED